MHLYTYITVYEAKFGYKARVQISNRNHWSQYRHFWWAMFMFHLYHYYPACQLEA